MVPVYQRQYRWDIGGCEQLLSDIRAVAASGDTETHFIGSILSTRSAADDAAELVLIDGQQRITTLMLLIAALQHTVREQAIRPSPRSSSGCSCARTIPLAPSSGRTARGRTCSRAWCSIAATADDDARDSRFDDNYAFFRSQILAEEAPHIWRGLQKLEHVAISLGADANAQQTFESLNSTGEPLRDHELIHNYVLMGLSHAEQSQVEDAFWVPIEQNTGESIGAFWRHYLVMTTGREVAVAGERGVYDAFRQEFPRLDHKTLQRHAAAVAGLLGHLPRPARSRAGAGCRDLPPARIRQHVRRRHVSPRHARVSRPRARR